MRAPDSPERRGAVWRVAASAGLFGVFTLAAAGGVLLHVRIALGRRLAASTLTAALDRTFMGRLVVEKIGSIDSDGFDAAEASVYDPAGRRVLAVTGLRGRASLARVALSIVRGGGDIAIMIPRARVEHADVTLIPDEDGVPTLARAFLPRPSPGGGSATPPKVSVWIPEVDLRTACVKGKIEGLGDIDVDVANVRGFVLAGTERTSIHVQRYGLNVVAPVRAQGTADTRIEIPSASGKNLSIWTAFDGHLGDVQIDARGELDGPDVKLVADIVRAKPEAVRALFADWPVLEAVDLHVESAGRPPLLATRGHAEVGKGTVEFVGDLKFAGGIAFDAAVDARGVDLRSFEASAPEAALSAAGRVEVGWAAGRPIAGSFEAKTEPFRVLGVDAPPAKVTGKIEGPHVSGRAALLDPAMSSDVDFDIHPGTQGGPVIVELGWAAKVPELRRVAWLAPMGGGQARWRARGQIVGGKLDARVDGDVEAFDRTGVHLDKAHVGGSLRGRLDGLEITASLDGKGLAAGPLYFPDVTAEARGPLTRLHVTSTGSGGSAPDLTVGATIERTAGGASLRDLELLAKRGDVSLSGQAKRIAVSGDRVDVEGITLTGAGATLTATIGISPSELRVRASAEDLDLEKIVAILAPGVPVAGRLSFDVDADLRGGTERGHARVQLTAATFAGFSGISAQGEADVSGLRFSGGAEVRAGELGTLSARMLDAALAGSPLQASSWTRASGRLEVDSQLDLDRIRSTPLVVLFPSVEAEGRVFAKLILAREELDVHQKHAPSASEAPPDVDLILWTDRLRVAEGGASVFGLRRSSRLASEGVDAQIGLHLEGESKQGSLTVRLIDAEGLFAGLTAMGDISLPDLLRRPNEIGARLRDLPFTAKLVLPSRAVDKYPELIRPSDWLGQAEVTGSLSGTIRKPSIALAVRGRGIHPASQGVAFPVDVDAQGSYDGQKVSARVKASRPQGIVLDARTDVAVSLDALFSPGGDARWEASGSATLSDFPLASLSSLAGSQLDGLASGTLRWNGIHRDPDVQGQIDVKNLQVDRAAFPHALAVLRIAKGGVVASAGVDQASGGGSATATARVKWASPLVPELDTKEPLDVYVSAKDLRAAILHPLLFRGILSYFDGRLDGTLHYHQDAAHGELAQTVDGSFDFRDGIFQIPEVGQEFRNASATIAVTQRGEVDVKNVSANGSSGRLTASGKMILKGLSFVSAEGELRVAKNEAVPLTFEGVPLGDAWGTLFLHAKKTDDHTVKLDVDVPVLSTKLPDSSARDVQGLDDHPDIRVGVRSGEGTLSPVPIGAPRARRSEDALAWKMTFFLGEDVKVRGQQFEIALGGQPAVDLTDQARLSGQLDLRSGSVELFGKQFEIQSGFAEFSPAADPSNPFINVTARWEAPDATIRVSVVGPLRTARPKFTSEPEHTEPEILGILLYGGTTDNEQQAIQNQTGQWVVGGAAVTTGVNKILSKVAPDITARVTSDAQSPTPEVAIRLSPKLTAEISYRTRTPAPFENQDRTLVTLDWRFRRNWSVATTVGTQTTVLDLIWRYRY